MKATIVTIGDEILIGQIVDTNSGFIAKSLDKIGVEISEMISISDNKQHILDTFAKLQNQVDLVVITGGLEQCRHQMMGTGRARRLFHQQFAKAGGLFQIAARQRLHRLIIQGGFVG